MRQRVSCNMEQQPYTYMNLGNGYADVFIDIFVNEEVTTEIIEDEEVNQTSFLYDHNEFRIKTDEITEEMISENPEKWLDYNPNPIEISDSKRIELVEDALLELIGRVYQK